MQFSQEDLNVSHIVDALDIPSGRLSLTGFVCIPVKEVEKCTKRKEKTPKPVKY